MRELGKNIVKWSLYRMGFTTDMTEIDIVYGSEEKLYKAILRTHESVKPKAVFVYAHVLAVSSERTLRRYARKQRQGSGFVALSLMKRT